MSKETFRNIGPLQAEEVFGCKYRVQDECWKYLHIFYGSSFYFTYLSILDRFLPNFFFWHHKINYLFPFTIFWITQVNFSSLLFNWHISLVVCYYHSCFAIFNVQERKIEMPLVKKQSMCDTWPDGFGSRDMTHKLSWQCQRKVTIILSSLYKLVASLAVFLYLYIREH